MEYIADALPSFLGAVSAAVPIMQSQHLHQKDVLLTTDLHRVEMRAAQELHRQAIQQEKELFSLGVDIDRRYHLDDLRIAMEEMRREGIRDVWAQRSRGGETLMVMSSLMIGGFFALVVEGIPAVDVWPPLLITYALALTGSFALLFLCLFLTMKFQARMNDYDVHAPKLKYDCGKTHRRFESYYACHGKQLHDRARYLFYAGTLLLFFAAALLQFSRWYLTYTNSVAAYVYISGTFVTILMIFFAQKAYPSETHTQHDTTRNHHEQDDREPQTGPMAFLRPKSVFSTPRIVPGAHPSENSIPHVLDPRTQVELSTEVARDPLALDEHLLALPVLAEPAPTKIRDSSVAVPVMERGAELRPHQVTPAMGPSQLEEDVPLDELESGLVRLIAPETRAELTRTIRADPNALDQGLLRDSGFGGISSMEKVTVDHL